MKAKRQYKRLLAKFWEEKRLEITVATWGWLVGGESVLDLVLRRTRSWDHFSDVNGKWGAFSLGDESMLEENL